jgi:hypothetical protein
MAKELATANLRFLEFLHLSLGTFHLPIQVDAAVNSTSFSPEDGWLVSVGTVGRTEMTRVPFDSPFLKAKAWIEHPELLKSTGCTSYDEILIASLLNMASARKLYSEAFLNAVHDVLVTVPRVRGISNSCIRFLAHSGNAPGEKLIYELLTRVNRDQLIDSVLRETIIAEMRKSPRTIYSHKVVQLLEETSLSSTTDDEMDFSLPEELKVDDPAW